MGALMLDEFTKRNRIDSIDLLNESIDNLKELHSVLVITSKAFKESIAKEKKMFERLISAEFRVTESQTESETLAPSAKDDSASDTYVLSEDNPAGTQTEAINELEIEGTMATEKTNSAVSVI
jgi:hypothetical protein